MWQFQTMPMLWVLVSFFTSITVEARNYDEEIRLQRNELNNLKNSLKSERQALNKLIREKTSVVARINKTARNISLVEAYVGKLESTYKTLSQSRDEKARELKTIQSINQDRLAVMGARARSLFMKGRKEILFHRNPGVNEFNFFKRLYFFRKMMAYDRALVESTRRDERKKQEILQYLKLRIEEVNSFKVHKSLEKRRYAGVLTGLKKNMQSLQESEKARRMALAEIERNAEALERIIRTLEAFRKKALTDKKKEKTLDKMGKFCQPVAGQVVTKFGKQFHATLKTMTRNLGVEFRGESGGSILSAAGGEVVYVDVIPGYGKGIIIYSGSGFYNIYGSLGRILVRPGDKVKGCQEIAFLPEDPANRGGKVYFEVRKEKIPMDPVQWLKSMIN